MKNPIGSQGPDSKDSSYYIFNDCEAITGMDDDGGTSSVRASLIPDNQELPAMGNNHVSKFI